MEQKIYLRVRTPFDPVSPAVAGLRFRERGQAVPGEEPQPSTGKPFPMELRQNPVTIRINPGPEGGTVELELTPDAIGLRAMYRSFILHLHNVAEPIVWDLGPDLAFRRTVPCLGAPRRICITCYGVLSDKTLRLVFRNWGQLEDGFPMPQG